ncbi:MAG: ribosomal-processing cysteine protease Prp [Eubacterium sp.]|nr:ribosomal-processing cysteine protease Prp [Eubacterium sp.]
MNTVTIRRDKEGFIKGFTSQGHSGYAESGNDIVCAAISVLVINTVNSIESFTKSSADVSSDEENAVISCEVESYKNDDVQLLFKSLLLGLESIYKNYGNEYIRIIFKEVY